MRKQTLSYSDPAAWIETEEVSQTFSVLLDQLYDAKNRWIAARALHSLWSEIFYALELSDDGVYLTKKLFPPEYGDRFDALFQRTMEGNTEWFEREKTLSVNSWAGHRAYLAIAYMNQVFQLEAPTLRPDPHEIVSVYYHRDVGCSSYEEAVRFREIMDHVERLRNPTPSCETAQSPDPEPKR